MDIPVDDGGIINVGESDENTQQNLKLINNIITRDFSDANIINKKYIGYLYARQGTSLPGNLALNYEASNPVDKYNILTRDYWHDDQWIHKSDFAKVFN